MTLADDLKSVAYAARGIAGERGFRIYTVELVIRRNQGGAPGSFGDESSEIVIPITEGDGQPPRVRWLTDEELAVGQIESGTVEIGAITPSDGTVGTDITIFQAESYAQGDTRHIRLTGPKHPRGALYAISSIKAERALRIMLQCKPVEPAYPLP